MVGTVMLIKILHCKRLRKRKTSNNVEVNTESTSATGETRDIKMETINNEDYTCRVCLKEGNLPIFGNDTSEDISEALNTFGAIQVNADDSFPKFLCESCHSLLQGAILLRKTAQQTDLLLKQPIEDKFSDIEDNLSDSFDNDNSLDFEEHKEKKKRNHHCKKCSIDFPTFKEYNEHRLSEEHENMRHVCPVCNKSYTALYFKKHLSLHKLESLFICDICGKNFIIQGQFTRHRLTHFYELPFKCSLCPYKGRFSESLKMHMRSHTGEKPYQCSQCPARCTSKSNLNKHMMIHKADHDFKCDSCGRGFYTKRDLDMHFKVDHKGIKDHVCNLCGKAFGYRKQMMKHQLKVHKRDKLRSGRMPLYLQVETMKEQGKDVAAEV